MVWRGGHAKNENFIEASSIVIDVDDGLTLQRAAAAIGDYAAVIVTTKSHQKEKAGKVCDRYRVYMPTDGVILDPEVYRATVGRWIAELGGDRQGKSPAQHFLPGVDIWGVFYGKSIPHEIPPPKRAYGAMEYVPGWSELQADDIMRRAKKGDRNKSAFCAAIRLYRAGRAPDSIIAFIEQRTDLERREIIQAVQSAANYQKR